MQKSQTWCKLDYKQGGHKRKGPVGQEVYKNILRFILAVRESQSQTPLNVKDAWELLCTLTFFFNKNNKNLFQEQDETNEAQLSITQMVWIETAKKQISNFANV